MIAVNLPKSNIKSLSVSSNVHSKKCHGSGVLLLFKDDDDDSKKCHDDGYEITMSQNNFSNNNVMCNLSDPPQCSLYHSANIPSILPIVYAAGLTVIYAQENVPVTVKIMNSSFNENVGGSLLIIHYNNSLSHSQTFVGKNSTFKKNKKHGCQKGALNVIFLLSTRSEKIKRTDDIYQPLHVSDTNFFGNGEENSIGAHITAINVYKLSVEFIFSDVWFQNNSACMHVTGYPVSSTNYIKIVLTSIKANLNLPLQKSDYISGSLVALLHSSSVFKIVNVYSVLIDGNSEFEENMGSVFEITQSNIALGGNLSCTSNSGYRGACIYFRGKRRIHLKSGLQANFSNNFARTFGGAIFIDDRPFTEKECLIKLDDINSTNISMSFNHNLVNIEGNSFYSATRNILSCCVDKTKLLNMQQVKSLYEKLFHAPINETISTAAESIHICNGHKIFHVYPGQTFQIPVNTLNAINSTSSSMVMLSTIANYSISDSQLPYSFKHWSLREEEYLQITIRNVNCTPMNVTIYANDTRVHGKVLLSLQNKNKFEDVSVKLMECPYGFKLDSGKCNCSPFIRGLPQISGFEASCNISTQTLSLPSYRWAGLIPWQHNRSVFAVSHACYYCKSSHIFQFKNIKVTDSGSYIIYPSSNMTLCSKGRTGPLCSKCTKSNESSVFGSDKCEYCSNWWLLTLILYILAGPLLIYVLFALKLTLTSGTLNGIIFYVQILMMNMQFFQKLCQSFFYQSAFTLLCLIGLSFSFPVCFYNGMSNIAKAGFSLLFPLYLLSIVIGLIIASRYSVRLSNKIAHSSVQVLVTVSHISFNNIVFTVINIFTQALIYIDCDVKPRYVWVFDASRDFGQGPHLVLLILSFIIMSITVVPYCIVIIFGSCLMKKIKYVRKYIRPIYEAIHGPFKYEKRYWFALRYKAMISLWMINALLSNNLHVCWSLIICILQFLLTFQAYSRPFKSKVVNILSLVPLIILNIQVMLFALTYDKRNFEYLAVFSYIVILIFSMVICYHILLVTGQMVKVEHVFRLIQEKYKVIKMFNKPLTSVEIDNFKELEGSFFNDKYSQIREPLLSITHSRANYN
jgi:predicted outer membrane repeat protein